MVVLAWSCVAPAARGLLSSMHHSRGVTDMRSLAFAMLLAGISSTAFAADPSNIIGTWVATATSGAEVGTPQAISATDKPAISHDLAGTWTLTFDAQDGGAFAGTGLSPSGKSGVIVGAFRLDGKQFVL